MEMFDNTKMVDKKIKKINEKKIKKIKKIRKIKKTKKINEMVEKKITSGSAKPLDRKHCTGHLSVRVSDSGETVIS